MPKFKLKHFRSANSIGKSLKALQKPKNKYGAIPTIVDGIRFHSKKEAEYYNQLKIMKVSGTIDFFLRQVPYPLPGKIKYYADFVTFKKVPNSIMGIGVYEVRVMDVKGRDTRVSINKRKQVEEIYNLQIDIV